MGGIRGRRYFEYRVVRYSRGNTTIKSSSNEEEKIEKNMAISTRAVKTSSNKINLLLKKLI